MSGRKQATSNQEFKGLHGPEWDENPIESGMGWDLPSHNEIRESRPTPCTSHRETLPHVRPACVPSKHNHSYS